MEKIQLEHSRSPEDDDNALRSFDFSFLEPTSTLLPIASSQAQSRAHTRQGSASRPSLSRRGSDATLNQAPITRKSSQITLAPLPDVFPENLGKALKHPTNLDGTSQGKESDLERALIPPIIPPSDSSESNQPQQPWKPPFGLPREIAFIAIISFSQLLTQAGLGMAIAPLQNIGRTFGNPSPGQLSWFAAGYSLTVGTFILIMGRLGDMYGHKKLFTLGWIWYALWSLVAGFSAFSHNQIFFDFSRAMQGIGPAALLPNALAIIGRTYPPGFRKDMAFALFGSTAPGGFVIGAVFASLLAERAWWPWAYWIMGITCLICGLVGVFVVPMDQEDEDKGDMSFDYLGAITGVTGLILFNIAWNQGPTVGWNEPYVLIFLCNGFWITILFLIIETKVSQPLIPLNGLSKQVGLVLACIACGWSSFGIWIYYLFQFSQLLRHNSALVSSAQMVPCAISGLCAAITTGILLGRVRAAYIMAFAMTCFCVGNILLATQPIGQTYWIQTFLAIVITPWGMDMSFPAATIILSNYVPRRHQGVAGSLVTTVVNYSISLGLGFAGTVQVNVDEGANPTLSLLKGFRGAWYMAIGLAGLGIMVACYFVYDGFGQKPEPASEEDS
ncbi:hypothetical protein MMC14_000529 [Varicellaria rhodocarpa]|nr:hypothetical protein [Varicellaria rhodocarpa]